MRIILRIISYIGLALTCIPAFLVFAGKISLEEHKTYMLIGMALWFFTAPILLKKQPA